jgi:hypothetical protein
MEISLATCSMHVDNKVNNLWCSKLCKLLDRYINCKGDDLFTNKTISFHFPQTI